MSKQSWKILYRERTKHTPSGYSFFTSCLFDSAENKPDCNKDEDCMERVCKDLIEHAIKIIDYGKKIIPLTDEENKFCKERKVCYICKKEFSDDDDDDGDDDDNDGK